MVTPAPDCDCKVGRLRAEYDLPALDERIRRRRQEEEESLRDLASFVNTRALEKVIESADLDIVGDPQSVYRALTSEDVQPERTVRIRNTLIDANIDLESLTTDFVSYQTIRTHLNDCLNIDTSRSGVETVGEARSLVEWTRSRDERVIDAALRRLGRNGELSAGDISVTTTVVVTCGDCGVTKPVEEFLEHNGCDC